MPKVNCPFHADKHASMEVYPDGYGFCFVCWKRHQLEDVAPVHEIVKAKAPPEDLKASFAKIAELPLKNIRGLQLPVKDSGYFVVWPDKSYYKFRTFSGNPRYLAPRGHVQPLLELEPGRRNCLLIEGEINAMSCAKVLANSSWSVISPGAAGNFHSKIDELRSKVRAYDRVFIWTDRDPPGIKAMWDIGSKLVAAGQEITYFTSKVDANEYLDKGGEDKLLTVLTPFLEEKF